MTEAAPKQNSNLKVVNKNPTALVAGGAGFIGSSLCLTLISQNFHVVCVDNLSSGKKDNIKEILTSPNFTFIEADINSKDFKLPEELKIDYCFHLAGIEEYQKGMSLDTLLVNSLGTRQLLEIAKNNQAKFILLSSADLYSGAISSSSLRYYFGKSPQGEAVLSAHEAKRFSEALSFEYYKKYDLAVTIIRLKDVYGPKMNLERGDEIADLIKAASEKKTLKIAGDGLKTINPTYVSDIVFGIVKAALGDFNGEIFILVNPEKVTIESFAQTLKLVAGPLEIEHKKEDSTLEIPAPHLDLDNTKEKISWSPKVSLTEGISGVIQGLRLGETSIEEITSQLEEGPKEETAVKEEVAKTKKTKTELGKYIRLSIFVLSLILITFTIFYPLGAIGYASYSGTKNLEKSASSLKTNNNQEVIESSLAAQNSFQTAEKNLQYVSWLLKILTETSPSLDHLFDASGHLAESLRNTAKSSQILIDTADKSNLTKAEAETSLNQALDKLYSAKDKLEVTMLILDTIVWNKIPDKFVPSRDFMYQTTAQTQKEVDQLIEAINKSLGKNPL